MKTGPDVQNSEAQGFQVLCSTGGGGVLVPKHLNDLPTVYKMRGTRTSCFSLFFSRKVKLYLSKGGLKPQVDFDRSKTKTKSKPQTFNSRD